MREAWMRDRCRRKPGRGIRLLPIAALCLGFGCGSGSPGLDEDGAAMAAATHEGGRNQAPVIRQLKLDPPHPSIDDTLRAVVSIVDAEGDATSLSYRWRIDGEPAHASGPELDLSAARPGSSVEVTAIANDGRDDGEPAHAATRVIDRPPVLNGIAIDPPHQVRPGEAVVVTPTGSDRDGDRVDYRFEWLVNGRAVPGSDRSFSSAGLKRGDRIRVRVVAFDGSGESRPLESADIVVGGAHPEILSSPPGMNDEGAFRYAVEARDPDGDALRYRLGSGPEGMRIDEVRGVIEWRPRRDQAGVHPVSVTVRDATGLETTQRFEVTVSEATPAAPAPE